MMSLLSFRNNRQIKQPEIMSTNDENTENTDEGDVRDKYLKLMNITIVDIPQILIETIRNRLHKDHELTNEEEQHLIQVELNQ